MKIVMLCDFYQEGLEYQENLLVKYYGKAGHEVTVICSLYDDVFSYYSDAPTGREVREYKHDGARIIKLPYCYNILHKLRAYPNIRTILDQEQPDLLYVHDIMLNFPECVAYVKRHPETRMIMDYHADYSNSGKNWLSLKLLHGVVRKWFLDRARPHLEKIYPVVPAGAKFLHEVYRVPHDEMELLPLGTDLETARRVRSLEAGLALRRELGIADDAFVIFTGGKLDPLKGTEHLIAAFNAVAPATAHLIVIGTASDANAEYRAALDAAAAGSPRIHFRGWLDKDAIYAHLDAADVAMFPASQSVLWQQSIGMGLPLVVGERSALLRGDQDVSYLNRHDNMIILDHTRPIVETLKEAILQLTGDPARVTRMSQGALRTADEILDWEKLIAETLKYNRQSAVPITSDGAARA